jgi:outer membrane protein assembly factor BamB
VGGWLRAEDVVWCLNATNGQTLWRHAYASKAGSYPGPRMTPTVDGDAVYVLSRHGRLACLSRDDGAVRWQTDLHETCGVEREPYEWGLACSPTVWGDRLALDAGRLVVVHKATGALDFTLGTDRPAFSSPVVFHHGSRWLATSFNQSGLALYDLVDRSAAGRCEWRAKYAANAATPVVGDGHLFITSGYGRGCALLRVGSKGLERVYEAAAVSSECLTGVLFGGFLYAVSGDLGKRGSLRCVEFRTGAVRWNYDGFRVGGGISIAGGRILHLMDNGELAIAEATPERYSELSRAKVLEAQCRTVPVLANGRIYCRNTKGDLVCLDVRTDSTGETPSRTP